MKIDEDITCNVTIKMCSDGDFGVDINGVNKETDWVADHEEGSDFYSFRLNNFIGTSIALKDEIDDLFYYFRTPKIYIMKDICEVFDKLETNCVSENFKPDVYFDYGNQSYEACFDLKPADETASIKLEIKDLEHRKDYYESKISDYQKIVNDCNSQISALVGKLKNYDK